MNVKGMISPNLPTSTGGSNGSNNNNGSMSPRTKAAIGELSKEAFEYGELCAQLQRKLNTVSYLYFEWW